MRHQPDKESDSPDGTNSATQRREKRDHKINLKVLKDLRNQHVSKTKLFRNKLGISFNTYQDIVSPKEGKLLGKVSRSTLDKICAATGTNRDVLLEYLDYVPSDLKTLKEFTVGWYLDEARHKHDAVGLRWWHEKIDFERGTIVNQHGNVFKIKYLEANGRHLVVLAFCEEKGISFNAVFSLTRGKELFGLWNGVDMASNPASYGMILSSNVGLDRLGLKALLTNGSPFRSFLVADDWAEDDEDRKRAAHRHK